MSHQLLSIRVESSESGVDVLLVGGGSKARWQPYFVRVGFDHAQRADVVFEDPGAATVNVAGRQAIRPAPFIK